MGSLLENDNELIIGDHSKDVDLSFYQSVLDSKRFNKRDIRIQKIKYATRNDNLNNSSLKKRIINEDIPMKI